MRYAYTQVAPASLEATSSASIEKAVQRILRRLYAGMEVPTESITDFIPFADERNKEIYQRYLAGERATDLAREFGVSLQRIYVLIRKMKRRR